MKSMQFLFGSIAMLSIATFAATPEVSSVTMTQSTSSRLVTITYKLSNAPAVVTLDVLTNCVDGAETKWASIGGKAVCNAQGDVWKQVGAEGETFNGTITWRPDLSWPDHKISNGGVRARIVAWSLNNTPDYMVVDISSSATPNSQKYYPSVDFLPGGLLPNPSYRTTMLVMRKIMAKNVVWTMGSTELETKRTAAREATHQVQLTNNFYIGVFPVTQAQWALIQTSRPEPSGYNNPAERAMRPVETVCYNEIRTAANSKTTDPDFEWPAEPNPLSFLGLLRTKTGIYFDLPSEAQWEFAARAGNGDTKWGNGLGILNSDIDSNLDLLGRYKTNGGFIDGSAPATSCGATNGTAIVGSYLQNSWGLYDTFGNVWEICLDWFENDISANNGKVNIDPADPTKTLSGATVVDRVIRGGGYSNPAGTCRPAQRGSLSPSNRDNSRGFRVVCYAGLE